MPTSKDVSTDLSLRLRKLRGRGLAPGMHAALARDLGRPVDASSFVDLPHSDSTHQVLLAALRNVAGNRTANVGTITLSQSRESEISRVISLLKELMAPVDIFLFRAASQWCGAVRSSTAEVLNHAIDLVTPDQEDLFAGTPDGSLGVFAQLSINRDTGEALYDLIAWW